MSRIESIQQMLTEEPNDTFLRYALAMEYWKAERQTESFEIFESLVHTEEPHIPAFLMYAQRLGEIGRLPDARAILREGIDIARSRDPHAAAEMGELLATLGES